MDNKKKFVSLRTKLIIYYLTGMMIAVCLFFMLFFLFKVFLDDYFFNSSYVRDQEKKYMDSLQEYVTKGNIEATDFTALRRWTKQNDITVFSVSRKRVLLFDNSYTGNAPFPKRMPSSCIKPGKIFSGDVCGRTGRRLHP